MLNSPNGMTSSMLPSLLTTVSQSSLLVQSGANQLAGLGGQQPMGQFPQQQTVMSPYGGYPGQQQPYGQFSLPPGGRIVTGYTQTMFRAYIPPSVPPAPYPGMMGPTMGPQFGYRGGWF